MFIFTFKFYILIFLITLSIVFDTVLKSQLKREKEKNN